MRRLLAAVSMLLIPRVALACPVCFGQNDSPMAAATNMGIVVMLGVVVAVLSGFAAFIVNLNRRARLVAISERAQLGPSPRLLTTTPQEGIAQC